MPSEQPENRCIYIFKVLFGLLWCKVLRKNSLKALHRRMQSIRHRHYSAGSKYAQEKKKSQIALFFIFSLTGMVGSANITTEKDIR